VAEATETVLKGLADLDESLPSFEARQAYDLRR
jgi:hypothetical protein